MVNLSLHRCCMLHSVIQRNLGNPANLCPIFPKGWPFYAPLGSDCQNHEDEEEDYKCGPSDRTCWDSKKHVHSSEENDQGANRMAYWSQVPQKGRRRHQYILIRCLIIELTIGFYQLSRKLHVQGPGLENQESTDFVRNVGTLTSKN